MQTPQQVKFGPVTIEWIPPLGVRTPIGVPYEQLNGENVFVTLVPITFRREGFAAPLVVDGDFVFDGATIPRRLWGFRGFAPCGKHLWAALAHDWLCEEVARGRADRVVADAVFAALLLHTGVEHKRATLMELAVNLYRWLNRLGRRPKQ